MNEELAETLNPVDPPGADSAPQWQLSDYDLADEVVMASGTSLPELIGVGLSHSLDVLSAIPYPVHGWRLVHGDRPIPPKDEVSVLAAPWPAAGPDRWAMIDVSHGGGRGHLISQSPEPLRPGRALRRRGLALEWPAGGIRATTREPANPTIRLRNASSRVWRGDGKDTDALTVELRRLDGSLVPDECDGWWGVEIHRLDPIPSGGSIEWAIGRYIDLSPGRLAAGDYLIAAELRSLGLTCPPLRLAVS